MQMPPPAGEADAIPDAPVVVPGRRGGGDDGRGGRGGRDGRGGRGGRDGRGGRGGRDGRGGRGGRDGRGGRGRVAGKPNYKNDVLIGIVEELYPYGSEGWALVSSRYREASEEDEFRDPKDLKEHWTRKLCNNFKKPTGRTGEPGDRIHRCQEIDRMINLNNDARVMGASSGEEAELEDGYVSSGMEDVSLAGGDDEHGDETNAEGGVVSVNTTTTQQSIPRRPTSRPSVPRVVAAEGKQKIPVIGIVHLSLNQFNH